MPLNLQCPCSGNTHEKGEILERRKSLFDCQVFSPEKEYQACTLHGIVAWFFGRFLGVQCAEGAPPKTVSNRGKVAEMGDKNIVNLQSKFFVQFSTSIFSLCSRVFLLSSSHHPRSSSTSTLRKRTHKTIFTTRECQRKHVS